MALKLGEQAATDPATANNGANPGFDADAFLSKITTSLMGEMDKRVNALDKKLSKALEPKATAQDSNASAADPNPNDSDPKPAKTIADLELKFLNQEKRTKALEDQLKASQEETAKERQEKAELSRISSVREVLNGIDFADDKSRKIFESAYLSRVARDEEGNLTVTTDKGPVSYDVFLRSEVDEYPNLLAPKGKGGAGSTTGTKVTGVKGPDITQMSAAEIMKLTPEQKAGAWADIGRALT